MLDVIASDTTETLLEGLWPHQRNAVEMVHGAWGNGKRAPLLEMSVGAGKTRTAAALISAARDRGDRCLFVAPYLSLVDQTVAAFEEQGLEGIGVIQADHERTDWRLPIQVASAATLMRRVVQEPQGAPWQFGTAIWDEAHIGNSVLRPWFGGEGVDEDGRELPPAPPHVLGLTATPYAPGMGLTFDDHLRPVTMRELIEKGVLSDFDVFVPSVADTSGVKIDAKSGDYAVGELSEVMSDAVIVGDVVDNWLAKGGNQPTFVFCVSRAHARHVAAAFEAKGIPTGYVDANVPQEERAVLFDAFQRGIIRVICNVDCLSTGVDLDVRCLVMAAPTKSPIKHIQRIGRALRSAPGKERALIFDHTDNHERLGLVTDISVERLDMSAPGERKGSYVETKKDHEPKACPAEGCGFIKPADAVECPSCGFVPVYKAPVEQHEGELVRITEERRAAKAAERAERQRWLDGLGALARERGKPAKTIKGWYFGRFGEWPNGMTCKTTGAVPDDIRGWEHSRRIAFAKSQKRRQV